MDYSQSYITRNPEKKNGRIIQSACLSVFANPQNVVHRDHWLVVMCPKGEAIMISGFTRRGLRTTQHTKCTRRWLVAPNTVWKRKSGENNNKNGRRIGEERLWKCMQYDTVAKLTNSLNIRAAETGRPSAGDAVCTAPQAGRPAAFKDVWSIHGYAF
jgi:hypothetical protein